MPASPPASQPPRWLVDLDEQLAARPRPPGRVVPSWVASALSGSTLAVVEDGSATLPFAARDSVTVTPVGSPLPAGPFDTVVLLGVLEAAADPEALLAAVHERLEREGRLLVHATLGIGDDPASRRVLHPTSLLGLCGERFAVDRLTVDDRSLRLEATAGGGGPQAPALLAPTLPAIEDALHEAELEVRRLDARAGREQVARSEAERAGRTARAGREAARAELERIEERAARLERECRHLRAALATEREHRERMRAHRWRRLGAVVAAARSPRGVLRLPRNAYRVISGRGRSR